MCGPKKSAFKTLIAKVSEIVLVETCFTKELVPKKI